MKPFSPFWYLKRILADTLLIIKLKAFPGKKVDVNLQIFKRTLACKIVRIRLYKIKKWYQYIICIDFEPLENNVSGIVGKDGTFFLTAQNFEYQGYAIEPYIQ